jgi:hypothetical protein
LPRLPRDRSLGPAAVAGAAAVTIPLTTGSASALVADPHGFHLTGGTLTHDDCQREGRLSIEQNGAHEFQCRWNAPWWEMWVR